MKTTIRKKARQVLDVLRGNGDELEERARAQRVALERAGEQLAAADELARKVGAYLEGSAPLGALQRGLNDYSATRWKGGRWALGGRR